MKVLSQLSTLGGYLDQPRLTAKFSKAVPGLMIAGGSAYAVNHYLHAPKETRKKDFIKNTAVLTATIGSALLATRGMGAIKIANKTIFKGFKGLSDKVDLEKLAKSQTKLVDEFLSGNKVSLKSTEILESVKARALKFSEVNTVFAELKDTQEGKNFLSKLIPSPESTDSKHIFGEIKRLSLMGLVPVVGGIAGGIVGDKLTEKNWKERIPNKIKEGSYQYLANIFLCNVGAGVALWGLEKAKITSKSARVAGMFSGIVLTGIVGGSSIANAISRKIIDPLFSKNSVGTDKKNCAERKPEILDIGLHADDVATVAVMSGLKWIEPALPILYSISGFRAGIGYRNNESSKIT
jgi:hypothetical protein